MPELDYGSADTVVALFHWMKLVRLAQESNEQKHSTKTFASTQFHEIENKTKTYSEK